MIITVIFILQAIVKSMSVSIVKQSNDSDYFVTSSVGQNQTDANSDHKMKMRIQYFKIIDNINMDMNRKFK